MITSITRLIAFVALAVTFISSPLASAAETFTFENYFQGHTVAYGRFQSITGVDRRFRVDLYGTWNGRRLKLIEKFKYDDGERDTKIWYFTKTGPGRYDARRSDVPTVPKVTIRGNVARYAYPVYLDAKNRKNRVFFRDKLVKLKDGTIRNTATVFKFLLPVAKVQVNFARPKDIRKLKRP